MLVRNKKWHSWVTEYTTKLEKISSEKIKTKIIILQPYLKYIIPKTVISGTEKAEEGRRVKRLEWWITLLSIILLSTSKLKDVIVYVRSTLYNLPAIRADLVSLNEDCKGWTLSEQLESLQGWITKKFQNCQKLSGKSKVWRH